MDAKTALTLLLAIPLLASPVVYLAGRISFLVFKGPVYVARWLSLIGLAAAWIPLYAAGRFVMEQGTIDLMIGRILLQMDGVGLFVASTVLILATLV
ncbi:MAG TPA: hypothetical protein PJ988_04245, partial [Anaerolinea sp.]|nr:hypothetical protein [Anaerolinea sp.]